MYCDLCGSGTHPEDSHLSSKLAFCESKRPVRKTICQKPKGHSGSCRAVVFWEKEE